MNRFTNLSPKQKKWGLFLLLTGTLGFNLSMNPQHFNNIARNDGRLSTLDLAQTAAQPPGEEKKEDSKKASREMLVSGSKGAFKATVFEVENVAFAKFEALNTTEGRACDLCSLKAIPLQSSIDKLSDLNTELLALVNGKKETAKPAAATTEVASAAVKKGDLTEIDLDKWAEKCAKVAEESKLSCHKDRLIELSKILKNTSETEGLVRDYFVTHLQAELKRSFYGRTIKEVNAASCEGQIVYMGSMNRVGCYSDSLELASELTEEIMSGLRAGNSKLVVQALTKMRAGSFSAQLRNSQILALEGKAENNMSKFSLGFKGLDPAAQQWMLNQVSAGMFDSIQEMQGTAEQKSLLETIVERNFQMPVNALMNEMKNFVLSPSSIGQNKSRNILDFQIPSLADDRGAVPMNPNQPGYTPGSPGNIPSSAALASRRTAPVRGTGQRPSVWLPGAANPYMYQSLTAPTYQAMTPGSYIPDARGARAR